jgi:hypothetical protein
MERRQLIRKRHALFLAKPYHRGRRRRPAATRWRERYRAVRHAVGRNVWIALTRGQDIKRSPVRLEAAGLGKSGTGPRGETSVDFLRRPLGGTVWEFVFRYAVRAWLSGRIAGTVRPRMVGMRLAHPSRIAAPLTAVFGPRGLHGATVVVRLS